MSAPVAPVRFAAIGLDHRHIDDQVAGFRAAGAVCAGYCPETSDPRVVERFRKLFPDIPPRPRAELLADPTIELICCAAIPRDRADIAIAALRAGKDVVVDKPGVTTFAQLDAVRAAVAETGRIFSICFTERFLVRACEVASDLVQAGAIGQVVQTVGLGPHRLNRAIRPDWFFDMDATGGILVDIGAHQIDQFLFFTSAADADLVAARHANLAHPDLPGLQDFGELLLRTPVASGYVRLDWFTPDSLPTWGDGRLFILGSAGYLELRKYVDVGGRPGGDHVFLSNQSETRHIDASKAPLRYFRRLLDDVRHRTETAMPQAHVFTVCRLSLEARALAEG